jgi:hypothetical protein
MANTCPDETKRHAIGEGFTQGFADSGNVDIADKAYKRTGRLEVVRSREPHKLRARLSLAFNWFASFCRFVTQVVPPRWRSPFQRAQVELVIRQSMPSGDVAIESPEALAIDDSRARARFAKLLGIPVPQVRADGFEKFYGILDKHEPDREPFDAVELTREIRRRY